ncbi:MAG: hypothetical protein ACRECD_14000 [Burkholderiaceae bacterium]
MSAPPTTAELKAALSKTLHSTSFAKCMADALQTALAETAAQPQGIVLTQAGPAERRVEWWNDVQCQTEDAEGRALFYFQRYDGGDRPNQFWLSREYGYDAAGREWKRSTGLMVTDDFGSLVEVPA